MSHQSKVLGHYKFIYYRFDPPENLKMAPKTKNAAVKKTKAKKQKDPNAPKKPMSAYFFFMADVRPKTKADNPDAGVAELGKIMGAEWNKIKETAAADKYKEKATADKARYEKEMKKYKGE
ncbi:hypothetical protein M9434_003488 [Picochlorum sp. BPE23]|nr:hypothetical protein M9434_003488 [Picochlorum sp. BPE23]